MVSPKKRASAAEQSARFREAAKEAGVDPKAFERAFKKIVPEKTPAKRK
jgi:hypothetical protein